MQTDLDSRKNIERFDTRSDAVSVQAGEALLREEFDMRSRYFFGGDVYHENKLPSNRKTRNLNANLEW